MPSQNRELTGWEKQRIKKLITSLCANYDREYGCTVHSAVPKKPGTGSPPHGYGNIGRRNNSRCNAFALGKPYSTRLFRRHFCTGRVFIPYVCFQANLKF